MESSSSLATGCCSAEHFRKEMEYAVSSGIHDICNREFANMFIDFCFQTVIVPAMELHCVFWPVTIN